MLSDEIALDIALWGGALIVLMTILRFVTGWSISKFVARRLVVEPAEQGVRNVIANEVPPMLAAMEERLVERLVIIQDELDFDGGLTVKDMVGKTAAEVSEIKELAREAKTEASRVSKRIEEGTARADQVVDGEPGEAADAGAQS